MSRIEPAAIGLTIPPEPIYPPGELMHQLAVEARQRQRRKRKKKTITGYRRACFVRDLTVHHIHKQEHGGGHDLANLLLCRPCHVAVHRKERHDAPSS